MSFRVQNNDEMMKDLIPQLGDLLPETRILHENRRNNITNLGLIAVVWEISCIFATSLTN